MTTKTVIANRAVEKWGKSTSLNEVYQKLKKIYSNMSPQVPLIIDNNGDIKAIFTIDGVKIGVETQGDPYSRIFESIDDFIKEGCELIVCACRTRGATIEKVRDLRKNGYRIIWAPNYSCNQNSAHKILNDLYVSSIVQMMDDVLKGRL